MSSPVLINGSHYDPNTDSFRYKFPKIQSFGHNEYEVALTTCNIFNSFFNISEALGTNKIKIQFPSGDAYLPAIDITIPDGFYDATSFNLQLQKIFVDNKLYSINPANGNYIYYLEMKVSATQYAIVLSDYPVTGDPVSGASWSASQFELRSPKIAFGRELGKIFGFQETSTTDFTTFYGGNDFLNGNSTRTRYDTVSNIVPQINPSQSIVLRSNMVSNVGLANPSDFLYSLAINASFGSLISSPQHEPLYNTIRAGQYDEMTIKLFDNNLKTLLLKDTNVLFGLSFRKK